MLKLYKETNGILNYWETWDKDTSTAIIHRGIVGEKGESKEVSSGLFSNFRNKVQKEIEQKIGEGFAEIDEDNLHRLIIEYKVEGIGAENDLEKRHKLEAKMNEVLGWRGLGHCDGGSMGSGTMEICCFVVSFDIAKKITEDELKNTKFNNYSRIYNEN